MRHAAFPEPIEGELLYGLLARHGRMTGCPDASEHARGLFGRRHAVAGFGLPSRTDALAGRLPARLALDGGTVLLRHTLLPYFLAYRDAGTAEAAVAELRSDCASSAQMRLGVSAFRIRPHGRLRFCPDCMDGHRRLLGEATWLSAHQLPGSLVCHVHGGALRDSLVSRATAGRHGYVAADRRSCPADAPALVEAPGAVLDRLREVAQAEARLLTAPRKGVDLADWDEHYRWRLAAAGLMRSPGKVDQRTLEQEFRAFWGGSLAVLPPPVLALGETGWLAAMARTHRKAMHPLFHLLLDGMLLGSSRPGGAAAVAVVPVPTRPLDPAKVLARRSGARAAVRRDWVRVDRETASALAAAAAAVRAETPVVRATSTELERRVAAPGWIGKRRDRLPVSASVLAELAEDLPSFRRRRVAHWIAALGTDVRPWEVMRAAGLRSEHLPLIDDMVGEARLLAARNSRRLG